ncbi:MAG: DMT family transporter [archaeon]|nr:DMT family transporter [archaeon]
MLWFLLALFGAFGQATNFALTKKFLGTIDKNTFAAGTYFISFILTFALTLYFGFPQIKEGFWFALLATGGLNIIAVFLNYKALQISDLSLTIPMIAFSPVFSIFISFILLNELPTLMGIVGIIFTVLGIYAINFFNGKGFLEPFKQIYKNKGAMMMLGVAFVYSITANFDKIVIQTTDVFLGPALTFLFLSIFFFALSMKNKTKIQVFQKNLLPFLLIGFVGFIGGLAISIALTMQIVPYVLSVKRTSILFGVIYGGILFKETQAKNRLIGAIITVIGLVLILAF